LALGWTMGTLVSALGCYLSVVLDFSTGATIVCTFGAVLLLMFLFYALFWSRRRGEELAGEHGAAVEVAARDRS